MDMGGNINAGGQQSLDTLEVVAKVNIGPNSSPSLIMSPSLYMTSWRSYRESLTTSSSLLGIPRKVSNVLLCQLPSISIKPPVVTAKASVSLLPFCPMFCISSALFGKSALAQYIIQCICSFAHHSVIISSHMCTFSYVHLEISYDLITSSLFNSHLCT